MNDTHSIPVHDAEDRELCANENCGACNIPAGDEPAPTAEDLGDIGHRAVKRALAKALGIEGDMSWAGLIGSVASLRAGRDGFRDSAIYNAERAERRTAELVTYRRSVRDAERMAASPTTNIDDHPSYGVIDDVFGNSSNVVEFHAGPVAVGRCGAVDDDGCIRLMASGHGLVEYGAASIHLDPAYARQLLGELAEAVGAVVLPEHDPTLIDNDGDRWLVMARQEESDLIMPISKIRCDYGPLTLLVEPTSAALAWDEYDAHRSMQLANDYDADKQQDGGRDHG